MTTYADLGSSFASTLVRLGGASAIDPKGAAALMLSESGLNPAAVNSIGCVGLNQLCGGSQSVFAPLSSTQYRALSATAQLPYVFRFWNSQPRKGAGFLNGRDLYWLNFLPATFVPGAPDSHVLAAGGTSAYNGNKGLDFGGKGYIDAGDLWIALANAIHAHPAIWGPLSSAIDRAEFWAAGGLLVGAGAVGVAVGVAAVSVWRDRRAA